MEGITHKGGQLPVSYLVATETGDEYLRNGKFLRLQKEEIFLDTESSKSAESDGIQEEQEPAGPRRSVRFKKTEKEHGVRKFDSGGAGGREN